MGSSKGFGKISDWRAIPGAEGAYLPPGGRWIQNRPHLGDFEDGRGTAKPEGLENVCYSAEIHTFSPAFLFSHEMPLGIS